MVLSMRAAGPQGVSWTARNPQRSCKIDPIYGPKAQQPGLIEGIVHLSNETGHELTHVPLTFGQWMSLWWRCMHMQGVGMREARQAPSCVGCGLASGPRGSGQSASVSQGTETGAIPLGMGGAEETQYRHREIDQTPESAQKVKTHPVLSALFTPLVPPLNLTYLGHCGS